MKSLIFFTCSNFFKIYLHLNFFIWIKIYEFRIYFRRMIARYSQEVSKYLKEQLRSVEKS